MYYINKYEKLIVTLADFIFMNLVIVNRYVCKYRYFKRYRLEIYIMTHL